MSGARRVVRGVVKGGAIVAGVVIVLIVAAVVISEVSYRLDKPANVPAPHTTLPAAEQTLAPGVILFDSDRTGNFELYVMEADGSGARRITTDSRYDSWWGRISPDRRRILFYRTPKGVHDRDYTKTSLWMVAASGDGLVEIRPAGTDGWQVQGHAEWSPDGTELVMFGGRKSNSQIYVTTLTGRDPRQVTDRGGVSLDPSWSPDGTTIAFVGCPRSICFFGSYEIYTIAATGEGGATRITSDGMRDHDPYYSPDGTRLAWLTQTSNDGPVGVWNIRIAAADGSGQRRLTDDQAVNSKPEWSRDGATIYFHRLDPARSLLFSIFAISPDGSGRREVTTGHPGVNEFPST